VEESAVFCGLASTPPVAVNLETETQADALYLDFEMSAFAKRTALFFLTQTSRKRDLSRGTHNASHYFSIFKLILNWFLLSNELIVFTALFLPSFSAQIS
jgi:hypothetical protein